MATQDPFPLIAPRSIERRLDHFDETTYTATPSTLLYKFVDALCGTTGAGALVNEIFLARAAGALETIYYSDLDYIFGQIHFLSRAPEESYSYNPMVDMLTSDQWDEVRVKDAWYRDRITQFFIACSKGGTIEGIRTCVNAAVAVDCDIFEVWKYMDNFGLGDDLGRAQTSARNELVIRPHKTALLSPETRLLRDMLDKVAPRDVIVTVSTQGLAVATPIVITSVVADSSYFEVQKIVTSTPLLDQLPDPELLPIDLLSTEQWMFSQDPTLAPYAAFNITSESSYYYLVGDTRRSPIDAVTYGTLQDDGSVSEEYNFEFFETNEQYTDWIPFEKADSPDNYPGGKFGLHPDREPALNPDHSPYRFPFLSQAVYVTQKILEVIGLGGLFDSDRYKLPVVAPTQTKRVFWPEYAFATEAPSKDSSVSSSLTRRRYHSIFTERRDPSVFVR